jgi:Asp-tRNA(Asn)/Glu-tRNA(Gln) amidotransferase A subunit family amidase
MGFNSGNQPAGLTFIGKSKSEQKLYEIGYAYEQISKRRIAPENSKN